ncbi:MAG: ammonia monooxygenase [Rhodobacteraceae bacterium]|nr:ammonia monooxygenase [Paracoccaceae bacterium]|tara:strand:- start:463 stop:789 length:327 start_codon:yes stop_codon:yes gene_type:complete
MSALGSKLRQLEGGKVAFMCPGCNYMHLVTVDGSRGWSFNGDGDSPTFSPSVLVRTGTAVNPNFVDEPGDPPTVCHSFVTDGRIQFLNDCTHALAGQTVELPDLSGKT